MMPVGLSTNVIIGYFRIVVEQSIIIAYHFRHKFEVHGNKGETKSLPLLLRSAH